MITTRFRRLVTVGVAALALFALGGAATALAVTTASTGTSITRVVVVTNGDAVVYPSAAWANVGSLGIYATPGQFIDVTFTAESACAGSGWCSVRILVDGVEAAPVVGTDFSFNEGESATSWESHSVERVRAVTALGVHSVIVQTATVGAGVTHRLDDWTLRALAVAP